ncbi:MAG: CotH kinase family protein [Clostridia bacterium]|nr:CotH kinase family protein [Clostridia bacterium]
MKRFMIIAAVLLLTAMAWNVAIAEEALHPVIMISEVMASNDSVATYPKAEYTDWVEIFNSGDDAADLSGWGLSDNPEKPWKWQFPDGTKIRPGEYMVILCDKDTEKSTDTELHASFTIGRKSGEVITLTDAEGAVHDRITLPEMKTDISFGRSSEDGGLYCYDPPTPFAANGGGFVGYAAAPSFSAEPGFYDSAQYLQIIVPEGTQVFYTLDGSEPTQKSTPYGGETLEIAATAVIRARAFAEGMIRPSDTLTGTFFIHVDHSLPVVSVTVDPDDLWNPKKGMLTVGKGVNKKEGLPFKNTVYRKVKNSGVKYGSYVEMYDDAGKRILSQGADISLNGDYSLDMPQKSFKFKAKSKYGEKTFKAKLFPDRNYEEYKSFVLRNSGNDCMWTRLQDGFQSRLMDLCGSSVAHQAWKPYAVYLNGQYWGHMNLRERVDEYMVAQFEGMNLEDADKLDLLQANSRAKSGSNTEYKAMIKKIKAGKPAQRQEDLQYILDNVDVDNYFEFMAFEMFFGNSDIGNFRIYRLNAPGSKWKWLINDLDYGLWNSGFDSPKSYTKKSGMGQLNYDNTIFRKLLTVPEYKDRYLTIYGEIYQKLTTDTMMEVLEELVELIEPEMERHWTRWGPENDKNIISEVPTTAEGAYKYWQKRVERLRNVIRKRPTRLWDFTKKAFGLSNKEMEKYFGPKPPMPPEAI